MVITENAAVGNVVLFVSPVTFPLPRTDSPIVGPDSDTLILSSYRHALFIET